MKASLSQAILLRYWQLFVTCSQRFLLKQSEKMGKFLLKPVRKYIVG